MRSKVWVNVALHRESKEANCQNVIIFIRKIPSGVVPFALLFELYMLFYWSFRCHWFFYKQCQWQLLCPTGYFCLSFMAGFGLWCLAAAFGDERFSTEIQVSVNLDSGHYLQHVSCFLFYCYYYYDKSTIYQYLYFAEITIIVLEFLYYSGYIHTHYFHVVLYCKWYKFQAVK